MGLRISEEAEKLGTDKAEVGVIAYSIRIIKLANYLYCLSKSLENGIKINIFNTLPKCQIGSHT